MVTLVSFDIDGTLEVGDPPGIVSIALVKTAKRLGYLVGSCSDRPISHQQSLWERLKIAVDFTVLKHELASAVPSAPTATGMPDHVFVPVIPAAMMPPIAIPIECPVLPHTCAANSVAINRPRLDVVRGIVASVSIDSSV